MRLRRPRVKLIDRNASGYCNLSTGTWKTALAARDSGNGRMVKALLVSEVFPPYLRQSPLVLGTLPAVAAGELRRGGGRVSPIILAEVLAQEKRQIGSQ